MDRSFRPSLTAILLTICGWIGCHLLCEAFAPPLRFSSSHRRCLTKENDTILFAPKVLALTSRTTSTSLADKAKQNDAGSSSKPQQQQQQPYIVRIEYCTDCRWGLRGFWTAQELLSTFRDDRNLGAVTVMPSSVPGRFTVSAVAVVANEGGDNDDDDDDDDGDSSSSSSSSPPPTPTILWDRQEHDGFPEMKQLKQLVRDVINPEKFLGHSDSSKRQENETLTTTTQNTGDGKSTNGTVLDFSKEASVVVDTTLSPTVVVYNNVNIPHVTISYCTGCQWLMRAAYVAQELVSTFVDYNQDDDDDDDDDERMTTTTLQAVTLIPSRPPAKGGAFLVTIDGTKIVWDRFEQGRFPETKELKQLVRDVLRPGKDLGQRIDGENTPESNSSSRSIDEALSVMDNMDDDEAAEARKFFGVM